MTRHWRGVVVVAGGPGVKKENRDQQNCEVL